MGWRWLDINILGYALTDTTWEDYSFTFIDQDNLGLDLSSMFPVFNNERYGILGFCMYLNGNVNFKFKTNYYGTNTTNGSINDFNVQNRRENYDREIIINSILMLDYYKNRYNMHFEVQEPILRSQPL